MTRIIRSEDCGNSPKNILLEGITVAFFSGDERFILNSATEDFRWTIVGERTYQGKSEVIAALKATLATDSLEEVRIEHVVNHGKAGAVNGEFLQNGVSVAFCHFYEFGSAKGTSVSSVASYWIKQ